MNEIASTVAAVPTSPWGWMLLVATGLSALGVGLQKALRGWAVDRTARVASDAVSETIIELRADNERLRHHNNELVTYFQEAQLKIVTLASANQRQQVELDELKANLARVLRLHGLAGA